MIIARLATARVEDAPAVAAFQTLAWQQTYRGLIDDALLDVPASSRVDRWTERIRSGSRTVTIAWAASAIVGVASTSVEDSPRAGLPPRELHTLYLRRDAQGAGLGSRLLHAAIGDDAAHLLVFEVNDVRNGSTRITASRPWAGRSSTPAPGSRSGGGFGRVE